LLDSPLEEERFEPLVPLGGEVPETSNEIPPRRVEEGCSEKHPVLRRNRRFESLFLRRGVSDEPHRLDSCWAQAWRGSWWTEPARRR